jgi:hypothetical protein
MTPMASRCAAAALAAVRKQLACKVDWGVAVLNRHARCRLLRGAVGAWRCAEATGHSG